MAHASSKVNDARGCRNVRGRAQEKHMKRLEQEYSLYQGLAFGRFTYCRSRLEYQY